MRKNKDGYVLIYVVFVIIFLCIVAVGTCTVALNNIRVQTAYIEQLQDRYKAEGAIEKFMAEVCVSASGLYNDGYEYEEDAKSAARSAFEAIVTAKKQGNTTLSGTSWQEGNQYILTAAAKEGQSRAVAEIGFSVNMAVSPHSVGTGTDADADGVEDTVTRYEYHIAGATSKYLSYNLENTGGDAE